MGHSSRCERDVITGVCVSVKPSYVVKPTAESFAMCCRGTYADFKQTEIIAEVRYLFCSDERKEMESAVDEMKLSVKGLIPVGENARVVNPDWCELEK